MTDSRHISASGQWAACEAPANACPLGGNHISENTFRATALWLKGDKGERKKLTEINQADVQEFLESPSATDWKTKQMKIDTAKAVRLQKEEDFKNAMFDQALSTSSKPTTAKKTEPAARIVKTHPTLSLNESDYNALKVKGDKLGVAVSHSGGKVLVTNGQRVMTIKSLQLSGDTDKVKALAGDVRNLQRNAAQVVSVKNLSIRLSAYRDLETVAASRNVKIRHGSGEATSLLGFSKTLHFREIHFSGARSDVAVIKEWLDKRNP